MGRAKDIVIKVIPSKIANKFIKKYHYSGKVVNNSKLHFGAFLDGNLHGVMSFGTPLKKDAVLHLVSGTKWNGMLELNRLAFDDYLPKNSESRALSIAFKLIRKNAPHIKWILSFADGTQCGDGTIYRASGFVLTGFSSGAMWELPKDLIPYNGGSKIAHRLKVQDKRSIISKKIMSKTKGKNLTMAQYTKLFGGKILKGYMLRYIYFLDKETEKNLTVPILPFSKIDEVGAGMYKGKNITLKQRKCVGSSTIEQTAHQQEEGGSIPTSTHQLL